MDEDENQDNLINRNTSQGKNRRQGLFASSDDDNVAESEESGSEEEDLDEEDGEEEEGSDSEEDDDEEETPLESSGPAPSGTDLNDGGSSDEDSEKCPICLNGFRDQVVGTPENCNHYFCLDCIVEWSKNANSCPVDRITFSCIHIRAHYGGEILKKVPIQNKNEIVVEDEDPTNCEVCGRSDREDRLLLCDGCDAGYHMECLTPALNAVPVDEWFCPECAATNQPDDDQISEEEVTSLLADLIPTTSRLRTNNVRTRAIARTRQSERVRASVNRIRTTARTTQNVPRYLLSSLLDETIEAVVAGLNTAVYMRNLTPRPRTTRRRRKVGKKGQPKVSKGSRGVGKRRKRRVKKRRGRRQTNRKAPTSHRRIAKSLGLCSLTRGSTLPCIQRGSEQTLGSMRSDIGAASLSVFGNPNDLDPFDSNEEDSSGPSSPLTAKRRVLSRSALRSHQPVARPISVGLSRGGVAPLALGSVAVAEPVPDLLGSILSGQSILMMKSSDIVISRDGSLTAKKAGDAASQRKSSREAGAPADMIEPSPSHSGSPTTTSSDNTWKPTEQQPPQPNFSSSGLYSLSPSPPSPSSSSLDMLSGPSSSVSGGPSFRLKNAFTPRAVQVHSSASRLASKPGETSRFNGTFHKRELPSKNDLAEPKKPRNKFPSKPPSLRLDISEFPRIPKIKRETDNSPSNEVSKRLQPSPHKSSEVASLGPIMNQLTGGGDGKQLGRFATADNTERNTRQESQAHSRNSGGTSSGQTASSSNKASSSNSSRNIGSSDSGGGGLRITISGSSTNSCRQFSPVSKDSFRTSDGKTPQKLTTPYSATVKKEKTIKNEMYDPFEPTGSDSGSPSISPERPATPPPPPPPPPPTVETPPSTAHFSGVKVGAFRSFKFTSHSSKVSVSKLGPDFSGMSPTNKEPEESKSQMNASPTLPPILKLEKEIKKEIKKEVIEEEINEHPPFRISCPLGLKITSDLKAGGTRGFHFDVQNELPIVSVKPDPDILPHRTCLQSTSSNRLVWDDENPHEPNSRTSETQKKITVKEELKVSSSSALRPRSHERDSRSASLSIEERERDKKYKSKSHKGKRARSDRSSSGSCERSKKKRQKERKKEKKRKRSESRERRKSRSSSRSSSSHRAYNSKKKKKKKRDSRSESPGYSISPDKERKRKHKSEKNYSSKEGSSKTKEKKKSKDDRGKQRSKSPQVSKEIKVHKSKDRTYFRDTEITRHIVLSPNNNEKTITCTVSFKTESPTTGQETNKSVLSLPKEEEDENDPFLYSERKVSIKDESASELSDRSSDEKIKFEPNSPPWSPSLLDSLLPETKSEDVSEPPSPQDASPLNHLHSGSAIGSPPNSPLSTTSDVPSPKLQSPHAVPVEEAVQSDPVLLVKKEPDDLQWSPSHLDDLLLNELSDDVCSLDAASPDDVDLEEAILMKREGEDKEPTLINFSKTTVIPFLQDDENSVGTETGNHINEKTLKSKALEESKSDELKEKEPTSASKFKPQIKRVTWNLHDKASEKETPNQSLSPPHYNTQQNESWSSSEKSTDVKVSSCEPVVSSETSSSVTWTLPDKPTQESGQELMSQTLWDASNKSLTHVVNKAEDKPVVHMMGRHTTQVPDRPSKDASQVPWIEADTAIQVFPQTLPPLPLPPIFPPYAPVSEPTIPCLVQSSRAVLSQTPKAGSLATTKEPKMQVASAGDGKGKSKLKKAEKAEKAKNEEYMKKLHIQERAVEEVKLAIKPYYQKREITKDEYKEILRKAVQKICHSKSGEINPVKVVNLVKGYVDKYKHIRNKSKKSGDDLVLEHDSPV